MTEVATRFDRPELAPLWAEARRRLENGPVATLRLHGLTPEQRRAVADLLGLPHLPGSDHAVPMSKLDAVLRPIGLDVRTVVETIGGPILDRSAARSADREDRAGLWRWLDSHPVVAAQPALRPWVAATRAGGVIGGSTRRTRDLLEQALTVLAALPADGRTLPTFAEHVCGDPHALDDGTRLAATVQRAWATLTSEPLGDDAAARRRIWQSAGIACDALSTAALVAGLRPPGDDPLATTLRTWAAAGQAAWITLAQLRDADSLRLPTDVVRVVENPSVVAEALGRYADGCPPLVCVNGWPNTAAIQLLRQLRDAGCRLTYHGDLDGEGIRIAAYVMAKAGAEPWRMSTADYLDAVPERGPAVGRVTDAPWDADLATAMRERGIAVSEERVVDRLLADLA